MKLLYLVATLSVIAVCGCEIQRHKQPPVTELPPTIIHPPAPPVNSGPNSLPHSSIEVTFLYVTNDVASKEMRGVFQITNRLDTFVYILHWSVATSNQSGWSPLRREFYSPGMIDPHEQFLFDYILKA